MIRVCYLIVFIVILSDFNNIVFGHYSVGYQIHSNNDLEEWDQLLIKGALRFKVDLHYHEKGGNCAQKGIDTDCLLLSHDAPNKEYISYNSSDELVNFLSKDCQKLRRSDEEIVVSLCFKSAPDKCDSSSGAFSSWLTLVDNFYYTLINDPPDGIRFFLDGDAKPENCLVGRWEEWDSVWIQGSSPDEAYISNEGEYGRFQVLNDHDGRLDWYKLAQDDYGKFTNSSSPYHLWEPDAQADFHEYIRIYETGKEHPAGYCFAINIDIAMFNVYTTPLTELSSGDDLDYEASSLNVKLVDLDDATDPRIVSLFHDQFSSTETFLYLYQIGDDAIEYSMATFELENFASTLSRILASATSLPNCTWLLEDENAELAGVSVSQRTAGAFVMVSSTSGKFCLYFASPTHEVLQLEMCGIFSDISGIVFDTVFIDCEADLAESQCALVLHSESKQELLLSIYSLRELNTKYIQSRPLRSISILKYPTPSTFISSARIAKGKNDVFIFSSVHNHIMASKVPIAGLYTVDESFDGYFWSNIGVGYHMDVSVRSDGVLILVSDYGYCYNSHQHNTRSTEKVCSSKPIPSQHVLDYSIGYEKDWAQLLDESYTMASGHFNVSDIPDAYITPCHGRLLHGSFDQGSRPSVALSSSPSQVYFLELHEGMTKGTAPSGGCGNPFHRDGLILDNFPIKLWLSNLNK